MEDHLALEEELNILHNTRSREAQEIIGRMPSWIVRRGISVIAVFILLLFLLAAAIKYPETIPGMVIITPMQPPKLINIGKAGVVSRLLVSDGQAVIKNQVLAVITSDSTGEQYDLKAMTDGKAAFITDLKENTNVAGKENIIAILPGDYDKGAFIATGIINAGDRRSIAVGQEINIQLSTYPTEIYGTLNGEISRISPVAVNDQYIFNIRFKDGLKTANNYRIKVQDKLTGTGSVIVKDKTILTRIFEKLKQ